MFAGAGEDGIGGNSMSNLKGGGMSIMYVFDVRMGRVEDFGRRLHFSSRVERGR